jgi:hypothetical protein
MTTPTLQQVSKNLILFLDFALGRFMYWRSECRAHRASGREVGIKHWVCKGMPLSATGSARSEYQSRKTIPIWSSSCQVEIQITLRLSIIYPKHWKQFLRHMVNSWSSAKLSYCYWNVRVIVEKKRKDDTHRTYI